MWTTPDADKRERIEGKNRGGNQRCIGTLRQCSYDLVQRVSELGDSVSEHNEGRMWVTAALGEWLEIEDHIQAGEQREA